MEPVSQQQARQQPTAATHRGTGAEQSVYALQQTNQHAPRDQPCAQDSGHLADSHWHHPAPATITQRIDQMVQMLNTSFATIEQRLRWIEEDQFPICIGNFRKLEDNIPQVNKNFEDIKRRLGQLEQERGKRQAVMKGYNDAVMRLEKRQADTDKRINELEWEMDQTQSDVESCQTPWDELQTLDQTQSDVISNSNKDIHKGLHMEGKGEIHTPSLGRVTQGVGESDPAPPQGS